MKFMNPIESPLVGMDLDFYANSMRDGWLVEVVLAFTPWNAQNNILWDELEKQDSLLSWRMNLDLCLESLGASIT